MRMGQGVRTGLGHGGITCILQTQFSSFKIFYHINKTNKQKEKKKIISTKKSEVLQHINIYLKFFTYIMT